MLQRIPASRKIEREHDEVKWDTRAKVMEVFGRCRHTYASIPGWTFGKVMKSGRIAVLISAGLLRSERVAGELLQNVRMIVRCE